MITKKEMEKTNLVIFLQLFLFSILGIVGCGGQVEMIGLDSSGSQYYQLENSLKNGQSVEIRTKDGEVLRGEVVTINEEFLVTFRASNYGAKRDTFFFDELSSLKVNKESKEVGNVLNILGLLTLSLSAVVVFFALFVEVEGGL